MRHWEKTFSIKELSKYSGIKVATLRAWETRYTYIHPTRNNRNSRQYNLADFCKTVKFSVLNKSGQKISSLIELSGAELNHRFHLSGTSNSWDYAYACLILHLFNMEIFEFEAVLAKQVEKEGVEKTLQRLIFKFLEQKEFFWKAPRFPEEHLVARLLRNKLTKYFSEAGPLKETGEKSVLIFSFSRPGSELFYTYAACMFKLKGWTVYDAGVGITPENLLQLAGIYKPAVLFTMANDKAESRQQVFIKRFAVLGMNSIVVIANRFCTGIEEPRPGVLITGYDPAFSFTEIIFNPR